MCLSVKQIQDSNEVGFKTFWNYVNFSHLNNYEEKEEEIVAGVINFVQDCAETNLLEMAENASKDIISSVNSAFEEILQESFPELDSDIISCDSIFDEVIDYFASEGWSFIKDKARSCLKLQYKGKNGQYKCVVIVREKQQEFIFYSICPLTASEANKLAVAELITKINYGLTVGNFDLDFATGTIRYKTSINVTGDYLSYEMIDNLVKTNVTMIDKYLPNILAVTEKE
ncbi:MAG: YbjN domain-containing protein [Xenococcaceae cyanobacterium]